MQKDVLIFILMVRENVCGFPVALLSIFGADFYHKTAA
jgi:hypothetical protein